MSNLKKPACASKWDAIDLTTLQYPIIQGLTKLNFFFSGEACGPYGHDIHLREICAAWKRPPVTEMTRQEYESWLRVEQQVHTVILPDWILEKWALSSFTIQSFYGLIGTQNKKKFWIPARDSWGPH